MSSRRTSSRRGGRAERGFTLLDCEIAVIVLSLLTVGVLELTRNHEQTVRSLEQWHGDRKVWYVLRPEDPVERQLGVPARLSPDASRSELLVRPRDYDVLLLEAELDLVPSGGRVLVELVERVDEVEG